MPGPNRPVVAVIGGGASGLAAARVLAGLPAVSGTTASTLADDPPAVVLLEASERLGGKVLSGALAGQTVELGPDQFLRRDPSAERLCRHLGLGDDLVAPAASSAAVWARGAMRGLPPGLVLGIPTDLEAVADSGIVSGVGLERARHDSELDGPRLEAEEVGLSDGSKRGLQERSAGDLLRRRLGDEVVDYLVDPLLGGINAGSVDTMSLGTAAPQVAEALVGHRDVIGPLSSLAAARAGSLAPESPFFGLRGGLSRMIEACRVELESSGAEIRTESPVSSLRREEDRWAVETRSGSFLCDGVVIALPGLPAAGITEAVVPAVAKELREVAYATVVVTTFAFASEALRLSSSWTGVLVPRIEGRLTTAVTWLSLKWPWMATPEMSYVRMSAGRFGDERAAELDDEELSARLAAELAEIAGVEAEPLATLVSRFESSFPQYMPGHRERMARVSEALAATGGLELAGAVLGGIGLPACITSGEAAAARLLADLRR